MARNVIIMVNQDNIYLLDPQFHGEQLNLTKRNSAALRRKANWTYNELLKQAKTGNNFATNLKGQAR